MKKLNKILSLIICFAMVVCCLPSFALVNADDVTENVISVDETTFTSLDEAKKIWTEKSNDYSEIKLSDDGYVMFYHNAEDATTSSTKDEGIRNFKDTVVAKDEEYSTYLTTNALKGKYQIDMTLEMLLNRITTSNAFWNINFQDQNNKLSFLHRIYHNKIDVMSANSSSSDNITGSAFTINSTEVSTHKLTAVIDTEEGTASVWMDDNTDKKQEGTIANKNVAISNLVVNSSIRMGIGSYVKFKNIKITQTEPYMGAELLAMLNTLPKSLVKSEKIHNLKENVSIPSIDGVTWTSSDESVINSATGKVTRSAAEDKKVTLTATFTADGITYAKNYEMTVLQSGVFVSYYADDELFEQVEITKGTTATLIDGPEREHYEFDKWYNKATDEEFDFDTVLEDHIDLYATYVPKTYNVIFKKDGEVVTTLTGKYGSTVEGTIPEIPEKDGWTAVDWMIGDSEVVFTEATTIDGEMIINAKYIEGVRTYYTVKFMVDGEEYAKDTVLEGFAVGFPKAPEKENYTFDKWQLEGADYEEGTPVISNITLTAVFKPVEMFVTFYDEDKTTVLYTGTGYYKEAYTDFPANPSKDGGYKFTGWVTEDDKPFNTGDVIEKPTKVYAIYSSTRKVIYDKDLTEIKTVEEAMAEGWYFASTDHVTAGVGVDGGIEIVQIKSTPYTALTTQNGVQEAVIGANFYGVLEEDLNKRTRIITKNLVGKYQLDMTMDVRQDMGIYPDEYTGSKNASYINMTMGDNETNNPTGVNVGPLMFRASSSSFTPLNTNSTSTSTFKKIEYSSGKPYTMHMEFDTRDGMVTTWLNDSAKQTGKPYAAYTHFNAFSIMTFQRAGVGSYAKIKNVKISLIEEDTESEDYIKCMSIIDTLPEKLSEDPNCVTENLELPKLSNVTWSTSNPAVIDENGAITRWYDDYEVTVIATVRSGVHCYQKEYDLTIPKLDDAISTIKFDIKFIEEIDLLNWDFSSSKTDDEGKVSVSEKGVKVEKTSAAVDVNSTVKNAVYNAYFDLYTEEFDGIYTKDHKGIYDIDLSAFASVNSATPATISLGYHKDESFYNAFTINFTKNEVYATYRPTAESEKRISCNIKKEAFNNYKLRIDTVNCKVWLFLNDYLLTNEGVEFTSFIPEGKDDFTFNSLRISIDKNNQVGDHITIGGVKLSSYIEEDVPGKADVVNVAKQISDSAVSPAPENVYGLPTSVGGYNVEWKSNTDLIDIQTGEVFHGTDDVNAVVSAYVDNGYVIARKDYNVLIRKAQSDIELAEYDLNAMGKITNQLYSDIRYDLDLPKAEGVVWTSDNTDIITNDGKIVRNNKLYEDTVVTITATKNSATKKYPLTVAKYTEFKDVASADALTTDGLGIAYNDVENIRFTGNTMVNITVETGESGNITLVDSKDKVILKINNSSDGFAFDYSAASGKKLAVSGTANISVYVIPEIQRMAIWLNGEMIADGVKFKGNAKDFAKVVADSNDMGVKFVVIKADAYTLLKSNSDNISYLDVFAKKYVNADVELVDDTLFGAKAVWSSSNNALISSEGMVTNPETMQYATMTLTISNADDKKIKNVFSEDIAVDVASQRDIASKATVTVSNHESLDAPKKNINDNNVNTSFALTYAEDSQYVIYDFGEIKFFSTVYVNHDGGLKNYEILVSDDAKNWQSVKIGTITNDVSSNLIDIGKIVSGKYIKVVFANSTKSTVYINDLKVYLYGDAKELAKVDIDAIVLPKSTSTDITLPIVGSNGTKFVWSSSNESVITKDGKVTPTDSTVVVTLTVEDESGTVSRTFEVTVKSSGSSSGPAVVGGSGGSGGGGGAGGSAGVKDNGLIDSIKPGDTFTTEDFVKEDVAEVSVYTDIKNSDWYYEPVMMLTEMGVISGDGTGKFNPGDNVTREQFVKMILLATDTELSENKNTFADVASGAWYEQYIVTAKESGIVNGISDTEFGVGTNITRQDMATLIARLLEKKGYTFDKETDKFADDGAISDYAYNAVYVLKALGLVNGSDGKYNPKNNLTRAEAAKVMASLIEFLAEK